MKRTKTEIIKDVAKEMGMTILECDLIAFQEEQLKLFEDDQSKEIFAIRNELRDIALYCRSLADDKEVYTSNKRGNTYWKKDQELRSCIAHIRSIADKISSVNRRVALIK